MAQTKKTKSFSPKTALNFLKAILLRNGQIRLPGQERLKGKGAAQLYKKGYEIRFFPADDEELDQLRKAISALGLYAPNTFLKRHRKVQPLYGREIVTKPHTIKERTREK